MSPWLVRHLVYPLHERLRHRRTFANLRELEQMQWWSPQRLRTLQEAKLARLLKHAKLRCPFYSDLFDRVGVAPDGQEPFGVLRRLPLLDKDTIRADRQDLTWPGVPGGVQRSATGGSTGAPLIFHFDRRRQGYDKAARMRTHRWYGVDVGQREIYLWGSPLEIGAQDRVKTLRDGLTNELLLSAFDLTPRRMTEYLDRIAEYDPRGIFGYPSSLVLLCEHGRSMGRTVRPPSLAAVFVTGELLDEGQRRVIEDCFAVPVGNGYGSREAGFLAHSCPKGQMHVTDENVILEIVNDDGEPMPVGDCGEIAVTHLDAYAMPLIRYRTGDMGRRVEGGCTCGRGLSCLEIVGGRRTDHLVATDGTAMHGLSLIYVLREIDGVRQFQIHQGRDGAVEVRIVPVGALGEADRRRIECGIRDRLGSDVELHLRMVDRIEPAVSGKFRCVTSEAVGQMART